MLKGSKAVASGRRAFISETGVSIDTPAVAAMPWAERFSTSCRGTEALAQAFNGHEMRGAIALPRLSHLLRD